MREQLDSLRITMFLSYKQLEQILIESEKISPRDIQVLKNLTKNFFETINTLVQVFPEQTNEENKENKNNDSETN